MAKVVSVNVGRPQTIALRRSGAPVQSAIGKQPVEGRVRVAGVNLAGDDQADRTVHGGPATALLCLEASPAGCHRRVVAELLGERVAGLVVVDL